VTTISRDRAPAYQEGSTIGAPQAEQIADRWHVIVRRLTRRLIPI
jgi:transposase